MKKLLRFILGFMYITLSAKSITSYLVMNQTAAISTTASTIALVGHPNVGKSVLFHRFTGTYVNVSNYPGTTIEVTRATPRFDQTASLLDTPGVLSLPARSNDERATMKALLNEEMRLLIQVGDAKNLRRTLILTGLLAELQVPMVLTLNMNDEAVARGISIDTAALSKTLNIPVISTIATDGEGVDQLTQTLKDAHIPTPLLQYDENTEHVIHTVSALLDRYAPHPRLASRGLAILLLGRDPEVTAWINAHASTEGQKEIQAVIDHETACSMQHQPGLSGLLAQERSRAADALTQRVSKQTAGKDHTLSIRLGQLAVHRIWGWPILLGILYLIYLFVGVFGAEFLVDLSEEELFGEILNPAITEFVTTHLSVPWLSDLLVGEYGLWTMGMTYALALIFPIVTTFFIAFGILEDSGYFSRLSVIANRLFASIGLNGRAVLPIVLGLGCVTMATLTTRILYTPRERLITTFLLALAVPCSAQLGVVLGLLGSISFTVTVAWAICILGVLLLAGFLASKLIKGQRIPLVTELPPIRVPVLGNVLKKTGARLKWYLLEVIPIFLIGTFIMFILDRIGVLPWIIKAGEPLVSGWLGLPPEASAAFVMGFLRRDFGATGLFVISAELSALQILVGMVTITLFVPCIASMMMMIKEQGLRIALLMISIIIPTAFLVGGILNHTLRLFI